MKIKNIINIIKFLVFLIYVILIFFIKNNTALIVAASINMLLILLLKINFKKLINSIIKISVFIIFTVIINIFIVDINYALLMGLRLILVCIITYIFSSIISYLEFATVIENISYPLKIIGIDPKEIGILVSISIAFIPILKEELRPNKKCFNS